MKKTLATAFGLVVLFLAVGAAAQNPVKVVLIWDNPTNVSYTNITYRVYSTTNPTLPTNQWAQVIVPTTSIAVLNSGKQLAWTNSYVPNQYYFTMTAANLWGESPFSGVAVTPPPAPTPSTLGIMAGQ